MRRGNHLFEAGEYNKALIEYKNAGRLKPTDAEVPYRIGLVAEAENDLRGAFEFFSRSAQQNAHFYPAVLKAAEYYMLADQDVLAKKNIDAVMAEDPMNPEAHALYALYSLRQKNYALAESEAQFALSKDPKNTTAYSALGTLYSNQNNVPKALDTVNQGLQKNPHNLSLLFLKAGLFEKTGDYAQLDATYQDIFKAAPQETKYRIKLALLYAINKHPDEAEKTLRDAIAALPDNMELRHQLVQFLSSYRSMEASEQEIHNVIAAYPDAAEPYSWLVDLYMSHNAIDRAETSLNDALAHSNSEKQQLGLKTALARISLAKGDVNVAKNFVTDVLSKDPNNLDALFIRANFEARDGNYQTATADARSILREQPRSVPALGLLAEIFQKQGHNDLAIETFNQLVDASPLDLDAHVHLAQLYAANGDVQHAMDILFAVTKQEPKFAAGWGAAAEIAINNKNWQTAELAITQLDALPGQTDTANYLRGLLASKEGKNDEAIKIFQTLISANPTAPLSLQTLSPLLATYRQAGKIRDAVTYLLSLKSTDPMVLTALGNAYLAGGQNNAARDAFNSAIAADARQQDPYLLLTKLDLLEHKPEQAIAVLDAAAKADPADMRAPIAKAEILSLMGKSKEAIALYTSILDHNPDLDMIANDLAETIADSDYNDADELEKARQAAERFAVSPNPLLIDTLAWVYFRQGNVDQAQALMVRASSMKADLPPQFHYHYGAILYKSGNTPQAVTELKLASTPDSHYAGIDDAKALLAKIR